MLALAKGYTPGLPQLLAVLGITEDVARQSWRDPLASDTGHTSSHDETEEEYGVREHQQHVHNAEEEDEMTCCWGLVESIRVRQLFGGMIGDMAMLRRYESLWQHRFRRRGRLGRRTNDSSQPGEATFASTPPRIKDGPRKWLQFLFDAYNNPKAAAAPTAMCQDGDGCIHTSTTSGTTDALDSTVLLHSLSGYGSVVTATISGDSPSHMYAAQQKINTEGMPATRSADASAVLSIGTYVAELGRRCAAVTRASTASMSTEGRKVVGATLPGLATWLAVKRGDVPPSAIDFHCSNVIDSLLQRAELRAAVLAAHKSSLCPSDWEAADNLDVISGTAKTAMWVCSSSTNRKAIISLAQNAGQGMEDGDSWYGGYYDGDPVPPAQHQRVWAVMVEAARLFQQGVIASRVPRRPS